MDNVFLLTDAFNYLSDGHVDVWFKRDSLLKPRMRREFLGAIEDSGYTYDLVKKKNAELVITEVDRIDPSNPGVQGRMMAYGDRATVQVDLRSNKGKGWKRFNRYLVHHEMGHVLGLAHQFDTDVADTVMNYPTFDEIYSGKAANRLTPRDLYNTRNFSNHLINGTDDPITGEHYCNGSCTHAPRRR